MPLIGRFKRKKKEDEMPGRSGPWDPSKFWEGQHRSAAVEDSETDSEHSDSGYGGGRLEVIPRTRSPLSPTGRFAASSVSEKPPQPSAVLKERVARAPSGGPPPAVPPLPPVPLSKALSGGSPEPRRVAGHSGRGRGAHRQPVAADVGGGFEAPGHVHAHGAGAGGPVPPKVPDHVHAHAHARGAVAGGPVPPKVPGHVHGAGVGGGGGVRKVAAQVHDAGAGRPAAGGYRPPASGPGSGAVPREAARGRGHGHPKRVAGAVKKAHVRGDFHAPVAGGRDPHPKAREPVRGEVHSPEAGRRDAHPKARKQDAHPKARERDAHPKAREPARGGFQQQPAAGRHAHPKSRPPRGGFSPPVAAGAPPYKPPTEAVRAGARRPVAGTGAVHKEHARGRGRGVDRGGGYRQPVAVGSAVAMAKAPSGGVRRPVSGSGERAGAGHKAHGSGAPKAAGRGYRQPVAGAGAHGGFPPAASGEAAVAGVTSMWRCVVCTYQNPPGKLLCTMCQQGERPGAGRGSAVASKPKREPEPVRRRREPEPSVKMRSAAPVAAVKKARVSAKKKRVSAKKEPARAVPDVVPDYWKCDKCTFLNPTAAPACVICTTPKPSGDVPPLPEVGGEPFHVEDDEDVDDLFVEEVAPRRRQPSPEPVAEEMPSGVMGGINWDELDPDTRAMLMAEFCVQCRAEQGTEVSSACGHKACLKCAKHYIVAGIRSKTFRKKPMTCLARGCSETLPDWFVRNCGLSDALQKQVMDDTTHFIMASDDSMTQCPECKEYFATEVGDPEITSKKETGLDGKVLTMEARRHKARWRFRCKCATIFCGGCSAVPYHLGYTCELFKKYKAASKCRFCEKALTLATTAAPELGMGAGLKSVCTDTECLEKRKWSCDKILSCGHECIGIRGERRCLPCAHPECVSAGEDADDAFCNVCWVETLRNAPSIKLRCGHKFHFMCIWEKIEKKWPAARITFGFLNCPLCKAEIFHDAMRDMARKYYELKAEIQREAVERLRIEGLETDKRLTDPSSEYYKNVDRFAMDRLAFYMCSKCQKPYFGGMKACEEAGMEQAQSYKSDHLVCGACASGPGGKTCKKHGKKYITYKCKFCCNIGTWYCWGSTHFCDGCHKRQEKGTYLNRLPIEALPLCPGMPDCPLGVDHPPNGTKEFSLGCVVCLRR